MKKISTYLKQKDKNIITLKDCTLTIDLTIYSEKDNLIIKEDEGYIFLASIIFVLIYNDNEYINVTLDYPGQVKINRSMIKTDEDIKIKYKANDIIFAITNEDAGNMSGEMAYIDRLIGGRELLKDENHLFKKIYKVYNGLSSSMDSVHIEVLTSQILRDSNDISLPARLGKTWNPTLVNLKNTIFSEGMIQGLAFENVGRAISTGLVSEEDKGQGVLEQVMSGEIVKPTPRKE